MLSSPALDRCILDRSKVRCCVTLQLGIPAQCHQQCIAPVEGGDGHHLDGAEDSGDARLAFAASLAESMRGKATAEMKGRTTSASAAPRRGGHDPIPSILQV